MFPVISDTIARLSNDHVAFRRALNVLERQVDKVAQLHDPDFDVLRGVLQYLQEYPGRFHHPVEDLIYTALKRRAPDKAEAVVEIEVEHRGIKVQLANLAAAVHAVETNVEISRKAFCRTAIASIALERSHIRREENTFFSLALAYLTPEDWLDIDTQSRELYAPMLQKEEAQRYERLHGNIIAWDYEGRDQQVELRGVG